MDHPLAVGVVVVQNLPWPQWRDRVLDVERLGYDGVYIWDHLVHRTQRRDDPLFDGMTALAAAAAMTSRIRLGTMVAAPIFRHPVVLANQAMTIDQISGGRLELGIGAGGAELDHQVLGVPLWPVGERVDRFRETVAIVDAVLRGGSDFEGSYYSTEGMSVSPGPVQQPRPSLTIAAHGRRTLRIAAQYADIWNCITTRDVPADQALRDAAELSRQLDQFAEDAGRDPSAIRRSVLIGSDDWPVLQSVASFRDAVLRYREVGITDVVLLHPDHPAEKLVRHGEAVPGIVRDIAEMLPDLRREVA